MKQMNRIYPAILITGFICLATMLVTDACAADKNPCTDDIAKFCRNIKPGTTAMMDCLESHENRLSAACKEYEAKMGGKRVEMREEVRDEAKIRKACRDDAAKFCKDIDPKQGGVVKCLKEHANGLSAACRESIKVADVEKKKMQ
jgi:hypothetical protein